MRKIRSFILAVFAIVVVTSCARAQGFLPPTASSGTQTVEESTHPILLGDKFPRSILVSDETGKKRSLLSYKSYLEVFVIVFFSPRCEMASSEWARFRRLEERYKDWRVAFAGVNTSTPETLPDLTAALRHQRIPWPVAQDDLRAAAALFKISGIPEVVILDESAVLQYRGPIDKAPAALDAIIGHTDNIPEPEPPFHAVCSL